MPVARPAGAAVPLSCADPGAARRCQPGCQTTAEAGRGERSLRIGGTSQARRLPMPCQLERRKATADVRGGKRYSGTNRHSWHEPPS